MIRSSTRALQGLKVWKIAPAIIKDTGVSTHLPLKTDHEGNISKFCKQDLFSFNHKSLEILDERFFKITPINYEPPSIKDSLGIKDLVEDLFLPPNNEEEIQAARLIVIRRKKMKKHQRRKLWKRMKFKWAKLRINRKIRKEKVFQAELVAMVKEAEGFSAEKYVQEQLDKANHNPLPKRWKGKRLPEFIIRQLMGIDKKINYKHTDIYKA